MKDDKVYLDSLKSLHQWLFIDILSILSAHHLQKLIELWNINNINNITLDKVYIYYNIYVNRSSLDLYVAINPFTYLLSWI